MYKKLQSPLLSQEIVNLGSIAMTGMMGAPPQHPCHHTKVFPSPEFKGQGDSTSGEAKPGSLSNNYVTQSLGSSTFPPAEWGEVYSSHACEE